MRNAVRESVNQCQQFLLKSLHHSSTRLLKSENRFHAQHLLPRALDKLTDDHVATIYEAYQTEIYNTVLAFPRGDLLW
jgi:hypothetical protein